MTDRATTTTGHVRASFVASLPAFARRHHPQLAFAAVLAELELEPRRLGDPAAWIAVGKGVQLLDGLARHTNDAAFGRAFAGQMPWGDLGVLGHLVRNAPTLGAALANAARYFALQSTGASLALAVEDGEARVRYAIHDPMIESHAQNTELVFALVIRICREALGEPAWAPRAILVRHARPLRASTDARACFGVALDHGREVDAIVLAPAELRRPLPRADATLLPILVESAEVTLAATGDPGDALGHLRAAVGAALCGGGPVTIDELAARTGTSARTLQRRLADRGRSFSALLAETRLALARRYLRDRTRSLTDVALLLGYSELSAFSRAFRRWTGHSAVVYRRAL